MAEIIKLKGIKNGIMVFLSEDAGYDQVMSLLPTKINEVNAFLKDGSKVIVTGRIFGENERVSIEQKIAESVSADVSVSYEIEENNASHGAAVNVRDGGTDAETTSYRGTVRSGQCLKSNGNLVVVGDINPGAELIAVGDIVVMGVLRGIVHAGCNGNKNAIVSAVKMQPTQIRIADIITRPPDGEFADNWIPEVAFIKDGNIYIDDYLSKNFK